MKRHLCSLFAIGLILAGGIEARGTILNFNIDNVAPPGSPAPSGGPLLTTHAAYGDFVNSIAQTSGAFVYNYGIGNGFTPNISVAYSIVAPATNSTYYTDGDGAVSPLWKDVNFLIGSGGALFRYAFTPNLGDKGVLVNSFDVFGYSTSLAHTFSWTLRQDSPVGALLASGGGTLTTQTHAAPFSVITGAQPYFGTVVLEINHLTGGGGSFGMDNLNFDQVLVPEPSTLLLVGIGLVATCVRRRRPRGASVERLS
jgi:hypothetical protein